MKTLLTEVLDAIEEEEVEELKKDAKYISDYWKSKVSFRDSAEQELFELAYTIGVQSEREAEKKRDVKKSTLTQDGLREAALWKRRYEELGAAIKEAYNSIDGDK